ncbi:24607_t:CDS:2 [Cetraspora pellucida]|uniref:24607_t:CDS:1 n=1 Tax=Cetraspora pellucida TaxID=1433469 RepID=A0A9N9C099_9GLOM|nr:24607_t:CDS:2 [Cetraspora pellucida]
MGIAFAGYFYVPNMNQGYTEFRSYLIIRNKYIYDISKDFVSGAKLCNKALWKTFGSLMPFDQRGRNYHNMKMYEKSLADLNRSLELNPNNVTSLTLRGLTYQLMGRYE